MEGANTPALRAAIDVSSSGDNTIVAAVTGKKIRVLQAFAMATSAVNIRWKSGTGTNLTGLGYPAANGGYVLTYSPVGWFETASGEALTLNLSGTVAVGGVMAYQLIAG